MLLNAPYSNDAKAGIFTKIRANHIPGVSIKDIAISKLSTSLNADIDQYAPIGNVGKNFHTDNGTPYNYFNLNLAGYYIKATHIIAKSYEKNYPITFNISVKSIHMHQNLIIDRKNSNDPVSGAYAIFPLKTPMNIISTKFQLTGKRKCTDGTNINDWALELYFFDIFGTLYEMNDSFFIQSKYCNDIDL